MAPATQARVQNAYEQRALLKGATGTSAPRASSLQGLRDGDLDVLFAVDMFNEGVDVPEIDTVLMLRPTESTTIWMQQFGRGLRKSPGKERLTVVDYIGNHRSFLVKAGALFNCPVNDAEIRQKLLEAAAHTLVLPPGCDVTYDLEAMDNLRGLLRAPRRAERFERFETFYDDLKARRGARPSAAEMVEADFHPNTDNRLGDWFAFVRGRGDLSDPEIRALERNRNFLATLTTTSLARSYKPLLLRAMHAEGELPGRVGIEALTARFAKVAAANPMFRDDVSTGLENLRALRGLLVRYPIERWVTARGAPSFFNYADGVFSTRFDVADEDRPAFDDLFLEIIDWRLAEYLGRAHLPIGGIDEDEAV